MNWEAALFIFVGVCLLMFAWDRLSSIFVRVPRRKSYILTRNDEFSRVLMPGFHLKSRQEELALSVDLSEKVTDPIPLPTVFLDGESKVAGTFHYRVVDPQKFILLTDEKLRAVMALFGGNSVAADADAFKTLLSNRRAMITPYRTENQTNDVQNGFEVSKIELSFEDK